MSSPQPRLGSRCLSAVQWAPTFPLPTSTSLSLPVASFLCIRFLCTMCSFSTANSLSPSISSPICLMASTLWCVDQRVRVLLYGSFFHSGIFELARQPYVLDCFALMLCSSNACRNLSEPPTLTLIIPL